MSMKSVTLKDVAERAGVSRSAVSRAFTEGASISQKTQSKVVAVAKELGYRPNFLASSLTTRRTKLIGLVSNNFHNPIFLQVFDQFTRGLQDRGLRPLLVNLTDETDPVNSVQLLQQYSVDGVIVASSTLPPDFSRAFRDAGLPVVHSFGRPSVDVDVHVVGIDNVECGRMAARHLLECGYRKIAFMGGPRSATSTQDRLAGFLAHLAENNISDVTYSYATDYSFQAGRTEMQNLLQKGCAEAYFCGDDVLSIGALSAIQSAGLTVPENVGLIGLNDMEMAGWENINLTTIHQPVDQIIKESIDLIISTLEDPDCATETRTLACHVTKRGTLRDA